ncbi:hypothetical protein PhCBS80983_g01040 [Powellomyces hirtus]|uniref:DUF2423 domain-containing protein n=1 Tax=Powellomyces hirtus TaxID=109895 RepID=A0A507EDM7_9FUNG|nr:hypothetical protein DFJ77DRAFT_132062 [Powellomyces hirtus]TPX61457.1 hypothetical protein PhCBS80983_g01040 [Powellomyces hirtus]
MAKGLRSKSMRKNRAIRRETVHGPVEDARLQRLVEKEIEARKNQENTSMSVEGTEPTPTSTEQSTTDADRGRARDQELETEAATEIMDVDGSTQATPAESAPMSKAEKEKLFLSRNAYKKKMKARAKSVGKKWKYGQKTR